MERFTIDEVIEHCKRKVAYCEKLQGKQSLENSDIEKTIVKEYWEHRQVGEWLETLKSYKEIGLTSDQIKEVDKLYSELCKELGVYKKLEEQGLLLRLPCRIGDIIYVIPSKVNYDLNILNGHSEDNRVYEQKVCAIQLFSNDGYLLSSCDGMCSVLSDAYKGTWFLTKAEAEQALSDMGKEVSDDE